MGFVMAGYRVRFGLRCIVLAILSLCVAGSAASTALAMTDPLPVTRLGPETAVAKAKDGYSGRLSVEPVHGPAGTPAKVSGSGLPANSELQLLWRTAKGRWKVNGPYYLGREYKPVAYQIATVRTDAAGAFTHTFTIPEDFGFSHDIIVQTPGRLFTQTAFDIDMTMTISPKSGPVGTPITVDVKGIGWRYLQNSWMLLYDNKFTGWISAVTTGGSARFTIPATGRPGVHIIESMHGAFTFPYRNTQQNPMPGQPLFALKFTVTPGKPVLPPPPERQVQTSVRGLPPDGELKVTPRFSGIHQPVAVTGAGFKPGKTYKLNWGSVAGNRITPGGWSGKSQVIASAKADSSGMLSFRFKAPDELGGSHEVSVKDDERDAKGSDWIAPTAFPLTKSRGPAGTPFNIHLKGIGWSETANIYTIVYDNA
jgi:hypothetical protein